MAQSILIKAHRHESIEGIDALIEAVDKSGARRLYDEIATGRFPLLINPARKMKNSNQFPG
jgi:hypothetical protein